MKGGAYRISTPTVMMLRYTWYSDFFKGRGSLTPNRRNFNIVWLFFVVYLSHEIFHRVALLFSSEISFWVSGYRAPQVMSLRNKVVHIYRNIPLS